MGWLGGKDKTQDKQLNDIWKWIKNFNKNMEVLIKNNNVWIKDREWYFAAIKQLKAKDKMHDATDTELKATIQGIKDMAKHIEKAEQEIESSG